VSQYVVTGSCALLTTVSPLDGKPYKTLLYTGSLVPDSATEAEIEHNLSTGLIGPVDVIGDQDVVELLEPEPAPAADVLEEPARNGSTDEWRAFAIAKGAQAEDVAALKRDELVELYGSPA